MTRKNPGALFGAFVAKIKRCWCTRANPRRLEEKKVHSQYWLGTVVVKKGSLFKIVQLGFHKL